MSAKPDYVVSTLTRPTGGAATGGFVINLTSSTTPMALSQPKDPDARSIHFLREPSPRRRPRAFPPAHGLLRDACRPPKKCCRSCARFIRSAWAGEAPGKKLRANNPARAAPAAAPRAAAPAAPLPRRAPVAAAPARAARPCARCSRRRRRAAARGAAPLRNVIRSLRRRRRPPSPSSKSRSCSSTKTPEFKPHRRAGRASAGRAPVVSPPAAGRAKPAAEAGSQARPRQGAPRRPPRRKLRPAAAKPAAPASRARPSPPRRSPPRRPSRPRRRPAAGQTAGRRAEDRRQGFRSRADGRRARAAPRPCRAAAAGRAPAEGAAAGEPTVQMPRDVRHAVAHQRAPGHRRARRSFAIRRPSACSSVIRRIAKARRKRSSTRRSASSSPKTRSRCRRSRAK